MQEKNSLLADFTLSQKMRRVTMREYSTIGKKIKEELKKQKKTQAWLSEETGIQRGYLSELINGHPKKRWNEDNLELVANALNIELFSETSALDELEALLDSAIEAAEQRNLSFETESLKRIRKGLDE